MLVAGRDRHVPHSHYFHYPLALICIHFIFVFVVFNSEYRKALYVNLAEFQYVYTRDWHSNVDGQKRKLNDRYVVNGESIMYPGEGSGSNSANCRCTEIYSEV